MSLAHQLHLNISLYCPFRPPVNLCEKMFYARNFLHFQGDFLSYLRKTDSITVFRNYRFMFMSIKTNKCCQFSPFFPRLFVHGQRLLIAEPHQLQVTISPLHVLFCRLPTRIKSYLSLRILKES